MVKRLLLTNIAALGFAALSAACGGDTTNNYYGTVPPLEQRQNPCGNSPVYGKFLWEITGCKVSLHMKTDCTMDVSTKDNAQDVAHDYKPAGSYNGLNIALKGSDGLDYMFWLDPEARAVDSSRQHADVARLNKVLDQYTGFLMFGAPEFRADDIDDNAFIPLDIPFPGREECTGTPYHVPNIPLR